MHGLGCLSGQLEISQEVFSQTSFKCRFLQNIPSLQCPNLLNSQTIGAAIFSEIINFCAFTCITKGVDTSANHWNMCVQLPPFKDTRLVSEMPPAFISGLVSETAPDLTMLSVK